ncbi:MAG TPA: class I SAM-dependent methyltransferase [Smithellaceae bacterium]|nr:methyltransferase domain-containing protein [Bacteroidales bacterium]HOF77271.1 class I SAM-dependent methyltransferase [Smithellaceae bacterium]HOS08383.1 class I SAM-dependent methyltransferase [Smithellaceae bacterium]HOU03750.1 class I SAM-dependent methyltransferase [Smithellaceae bacterium]HPD48994.1 class I SAM-dependent methyltransferase [Smithellaceae bacterium]
MTRYDTIGTNYNSCRNADARIISVLKDLLGLPEGSVVVDVGAGTGNYSNALAASGYKLKAVEPSEVMRRQAVPSLNVEWLAGSVDSIPLPDASAAGVISTLAVHHFPDIQAAANEMQRVCNNGPIVLFTIDPRRGEPFWFKHYFPSIYGRLFDAFIPVEELISAFTGRNEVTVTVRGFPLPHDLSDMNMHSGWNRPEVYLDPVARCGMSGFAMADHSEVQAGLDLLGRDLKLGKWEQDYGHLRTKESYDLGFIFVKIQQIKA